IYLKFVQIESRAPHLFECYAECSQIYLKFHTFQLSQSVTPLPYPLHLLHRSDHRAKKIPTPNVAQGLQAVS
ncbi:MAG: hypothetical protein ACI4UW_04715, partial [Muribaculaceae bacterium]